MIRKIESAELVRYNANSSGKMSPDCVKRALSLAFDVPYSQIAKMLNEEMKKMPGTLYTAIYSAKLIGREFLKDFEKYLIDNKLI